MALLVILLEVVDSSDGKEAVLVTRLKFWICWFLVLSVSHSNSSASQNPSLSGKSRYRGAVAESDNDCLVAVS